MTPATASGVCDVRGATRLPTRAYPGDAGLDLYALEDGVLAPGERASIRTGIAVEIPDGQAGLVLPRSGLAARHGIALVNAPGLIDSGYRGEIRVLLLNTDRAEPFTVAARRADRPARAGASRDARGRRGRRARAVRARRRRLRLERLARARPWSRSSGVDGRGLRQHALGLEELRRDRGRVLTVELHRGVQLAHRRQREQRAHPVDRGLERRALGVERADRRHRDDVAPAEDVLGVAQQRIAPAEQLRIGRLDDRRLDGPLVERLVLRRRARAA